MDNCRDLKVILQANSALGNEFVPIRIKPDGVPALGYDSLVASGKLSGYQIDVEPFSFVRTPEDVVHY